MKSAVKNASVNKCSSEIGFLATNLKDRNLSTICFQKCQTQRKNCFQMDSLTDLDLFYIKVIEKSSLSIGSFVLG